jgi:hypothetical protein
MDEKMKKNVKMMMIKQTSIIRVMLDASYFLQNHFIT